MTIIGIIAGVLWGLMYMMFNETLAGFIPLSYGFFSIIQISLFIITKKFSLFRFVQLSLILLLPFLLMLSLGGFITGSAVILWGLLAPIGALLCGHQKYAKYWFMAYVLSVILSGIAQPYIRETNNLPEYIIYGFFVINVAAVSAIIFVLINYFAKQKELVIKLMNKNRELELGYLQQEITLRQSEKLATLGKLSAGMAHELNNPASGALRSAEHLSKNLMDLENNQYNLGKINLSDQQLDVIKILKERILKKSYKVVDLNPLKRMDFENELELWFEKKGIPNCWELASTLINIGFNKDELSQLSENFSDQQFPVVISSLVSNLTTHSLTDEIRKGVERIIHVVNALKSYAYLDQAPIQTVDIHEGLNNTLIMLSSQLKNGITVVREFSDGLPQIPAYGSELNQVWTNIIDNAASAMIGKGKITIRTYRDDSWLAVEIQDTGPGIPEEIQSKVFDPFFTTKPPGDGAGLGLNICHNIITQKHKGKISVKSKRGETTFQIKLPINPDGNRLSPPQ